MPTSKAVVIVGYILSLFSVLEMKGIMASRDYSSVTSDLKLIAFDLDGTIWSPDMYQLWGGGAPFEYASNGKDLVDSAGNTVRLLGISGEVLHELKNDPSLASIKVAWVSCTDEPDWAAECMTKFKTVPSGIPIKSVVDTAEIYKSNKQTHFRNLKEKFSGIEYSNMLFFDNEHRNIRNVAELGVKCVFCPDGITSKAWEEGLALFQ